YSFYLTLLLGYPQSLWRERHLAHHSGLAYRIQISSIVAAEAILVFSMWALLFAHSPQFFLGVYLPGYAAGLVLCHIHGYFEHAQGTKSTYGILYNMPFFNDGYHVEHHSWPAEHWTRLPDHIVPGSSTSHWPPVLRWIDAVDLEMLERLALRSSVIQKFLLTTHERALRKLLPRLPRVRTVQIVGGGMFPRTAILLQRLLPEAEITIIDANAESIRTAKAFISEDIKLAHEWFEPVHSVNTDLMVRSERALRKLLPRLPRVRTVQIVGGGMFPRTAILLQRLLPEAEITIIDANAESIRTAKAFISEDIKLAHEWFEPVHSVNTDLMVIPLSFIVDRDSVYKSPPATTVLIHDWIWAKRTRFCKKGVVVSPWLLKRLNLIQR